MHLFANHYQSRICFCSRSNRQEETRYFNMWFTYVVVAVSVLAYADADSHGNLLKQACKTLSTRPPTPGGADQGHSPANTTPAPYNIITNTQEVVGGTPIEVVIQGNSTDTPAFLGLMMQARRGDDIVGTFTIGDSDPYVKPLECDAASDTAVHKSRDLKTVVRLTWTAPSDFSGEVKFKCTIVVSRAESWENIESAPIKVTPKAN